MSVASLRPSDPFRHARGPSPWLRAWRWLAVSIGYGLVVVGAIGSVLPWHLGVPVLIFGLIIVLRSSMQARRRFIGLQQRHPKIVFPIRRLLRREPEVIPVAWQQVLRFERLIMPRSWRTAMRIRHRLFRRR